MSECHIDSYEVKRWLNSKGQFHREDGPAILWKSGDEEWWLNNKLHRENGPAISYSSGYKAWYVNGECHREDGPAIENADKTKEWYYKGKCIKCSSTKKFLKIIKLKAFW